MLKALARLATSSRNTPPATPPKPRPTSSQLPIIVPQSAIDALPEDPHPLVDAVIDYVNILFNEGHFGRWEVPPLAIQAYHADYYLAQVLNGGHSQFTHNCGANLAVITEDVCDALTSMGATAYLDIFTPYTAWLRTNRDEARRQTGFEGGRAAPLETLDDAFFALEQTDTLRQNLAAWIAAAPNLVVVPDSRLAQARTEACATNPQFAARQRLKSIATLKMHLSDPTQVAISLACGTSQPLGALIKIGGGSYMEVGGAQEMCFSVQTTAGRRWAVIREKSVSLHASIEHDNPQIPANPLEATLEQISDYKAPEIGECLASASAEAISTVLQVAEKLNAAHAVDALLSRCASPATLDRSTIRSAGPGPDGRLGLTLLLVTNNATQAFCAVVTEAGAFLLSEPDHTRIATVSAAEIKAHMAAHPLNS